MKLALEKRIDYIIVGMGLAGACLAIQLLKRGKRIFIYDLPGQNRASRIAAGLFNPITGKRIVKTWKADILFPYLNTFYSDVEKQFGIQFYYPKPLYTPFRSIEEQNEWMARSADKSFSDYLLKVESKATYSAEVRDPLGGILLAQCGYINTNRMLEAVRNHLTNSGCYREEEFNDDFLQEDKSGVRFKDLVADKVIFCTGIHALGGKFFDWLSLKPLKGEVLTIKTSSSLNRIYNRGVYLIESEEMKYKVGATYDLSNLEENTTEKGRSELENKLEDLLAMSFEVTHQDWGIRPSTTDRRLFVGEHPGWKNILIFNGLGTKGVSLAPYFSGQLADYLTSRGNLDEEANINRVKSLYSRFQ